MVFAFREIVLMFAVYVGNCLATCWQLVGNWLAALVAHWILDVCEQTQALAPSATGFAANAARSGNDGGGANLSGC